MGFIKRAGMALKAAIVLFSFLLIAFGLPESNVMPSFFKKSAGPQVATAQGLSLIKAQAPAAVPSRGPVPIYFNSPVKPGELKKNIALPEPGVLKPCAVNMEKDMGGFNCYYYYPQKPLGNSAGYSISLRPFLKNVSGQKITGSLSIEFITAPKPVILNTFPEQAQNNVKLFTTLFVELDQKIREVKITLLGEEGELLTGTTEINGCRAVFQPDKAFLPDSKYNILFEGITEGGETFSAGPHQFGTISMGNKTWVEVNLKYVHTVSVYRGKRCVKKMLASGGKYSTPTPLGEFYTQDRGYSFYSPKFGEGALYYVRLVGKILVHSVPKDENWNTKMDEHEKLGLPASHGCVRLDEADARWFYINVPANTLVIIHK